MVDRNKLKEKYGDEKVLVVDINDLPPLDGTLTEYPDVQSDIILEKMLDKSYFIYRWESDYNPDEVEIIPYPLIMNYDSNLIYCVKRIGGSNEQRLVNKLSLGIGGHINHSGNKQGADLMRYSMQRELNEELELHPGVVNNGSLIFKGFIRVTETSVDKDHLGLLYFIQTYDALCKDEYVKVRETDTLEGEFVEIDFLKNNYDKLENWSAIAVDNI